MCVDVLKEDCSRSYITELSLQSHISLFMKTKQNKTPQSCFSVWGKELCELLISQTPKI